jgi:FAD/FMN-containing dehydrogenase
MTTYGIQLSRPGTAARRLRGVFTGDVHQPGDPRYDAARPAWNRRIDPRPAIVAEAAGRDDVWTAVLVAREHDLPLAVQATGHGTVTPADDGLLLKTARMASVRVDPYRGTARTGPGALWSDVIAAAQPYGLAPVSGTPSIGVTGYTLGGGAGWLSRMYGFAADNLLSAEMVTADGEIVTADADRHPDLFWALRGGSGNFGVVTALEFRLHPVDHVYAGVSLYPLDRAADVLQRYRDWAAREPDRLNTSVTLLRMPATPQVPEPMRGRRLLAVRVFYAGRYEDADQHLGPLLAAAGPPLQDGFNAMTFAEAGQAIAGPPPAPIAAVQHIDLFQDLPDAVLDTLLDAIEPGPDSPPSAVSAIEVRHWGGAMARPTPDSGPAGHRDVPFSVLATAIDPDPARHDSPIDNAVTDLATRLRPHATGGSFLNFLTDPARTATAFTETNYRRLREAKKTWDPDNVFHLNHNIPPA